MTNSDVFSDGFLPHDSEIVSISMDRLTSVCRVSLRDVGAQQNVVDLFGVKAFRAEDFVLQNVVSRMLRSTAKDFSTDEIDYWVTWATSFSDSASWLKPDRKHRWLASLSENAPELVVFEPSIGAQIAVVCERLLFRPSESELSWRDCN